MLGYAQSRHRELAVGMAAGACVTSAMPKANKSLRGEQLTSEPEVFEPLRKREASVHTAFENATKAAAMELASGKSWQEVAATLGNTIMLQMSIMATTKVAGKIHSRRRHLVKMRLDPWRKSL